MQEKYYYLPNIFNELFAGFKGKRGLP